MGELSKKIGDTGEALVLAFFDRIGWSPVQTGIDIECDHAIKHKLKNSKGDRKSHGVDLISSYPCPVAPGERRNVLISVKNSNQERSQNCPSLIRDDFRDLNNAIECFLHSKERLALLRGGGTRIDDVGLLIRINRDRDVDRSFLKSDFENLARISQAGNLYFMENDRFDFVDSCMNFLDINFREAINTFNIQRTSLSVGGEVRLPDSALLPLHSLVGGPIIVRSVLVERKSLIIFSDESFSESCLVRLVGLAQVAAGWPTEVRLVFSDYDSTFSRIVDDVRVRIEDRKFAKSIICDSFEIRSRLK